MIVLTAPRTTLGPGAVVAASAASVLSLEVLLAMAGMRVDWRGPVGILGMVLCAALPFRAGWLGHARVGRALADGAAYIVLFAILCLVGALATYPLAALSRGYADAVFQRIDLWLRFDWIAWYEMVAAHRSLQLAGRAAYASIYLTPALILGHFAWTGDRASASRFLLAFWLAIMITLALYPAMPAAGPFATLWTGSIPYMPSSALCQPELIASLRQMPKHLIDPFSLCGLVSAPSFHTAAAIVYILAAWPLGRLRWPVMVVNVAMILSTPVEGTHYLIDLILGAGVALFAWWFVGRYASLFIFLRLTIGPRWPSAVSLNEAARIASGAAAAQPTERRP